MKITDTDTTKLAVENNSTAADNGAASAAIAASTSDPTALLAVAAAAASYTSSIQQQQSSLTAAGTNQLLQNFQQPSPPKRLKMEDTNEGKSGKLEFRNWLQMLEINVRNITHL